MRPSFISFIFHFIICVQFLCPNYILLVSSANQESLKNSKISKQYPLNDNDLSLPTSNNLTRKEYCRLEIARLCGDRVNVDAITDLEAFDCILNKQRNEAVEVSQTCNHKLWTFRQNLISDEGFKHQIGPNCTKDIEKSPCHSPSVAPQPKLPTFLISCVIDNLSQLNSSEICRQTISLVERVMFSDYELIERFASTCANDIEKTQCGRNDLSRQKVGIQFLPNSQGQTIECLSKQISKVSNECAVEILRIAEHQAEDYHLDRALYFSCRDDRERFCASVSAGGGKVYQCLNRHKNEETMSTGCREQLQRRQKLSWLNYKASGLVFSCKNEIRKNMCRKGATTIDKHIRMSQILLCLENAMHSGQKIDGECLDEMKQHRKALMEDHRLTPELLNDCTEDIVKFCKNRKVNGKTIHCLMEHALIRNEEEMISAQCRARLEDLVRMADVTEDWRVDPVLKENCQPVVAKSSCHNLPGNQVMDCLMRLLYADTKTDSDFADAHAMTDDCEVSLLQIQYFVARDFSLDSSLYKACHEDAERICHVSGNWSGNTLRDSPNPGPMVLSCLYRNMEEKLENRDKVSPRCREKVQDTMRQRAISVHLMPEIDKPCLIDLAVKCSGDSTKANDEMECLQNHLEDLEEPCKEAVKQFTKIEISNPTIDPYLWKYCHEIIETKCASSANPKRQSKSNEDDEDDLFECLVKSKPDMKNKACRTTVDHYQLLQLRDIEFTPKFKSLCHGDVIRHCNIQPKTSSKLVSCLSEVIWNDTIHDNNPRVSKGCRKQVKYLILSKVQIESKTDHETIYNLCGKFVELHCSQITPGGGRIFECLRSHRELITERNCYNALFKLEQQVDNDNSLDVHLINECEPEIKLFCAGRTYQKEYNPSLQMQNLVECLRFSREKEGFNNEKCGKVLQARLLEQNTDVRLNPTLRKACLLDIPKFCKKVPAGEAKVTGCLKRIFVRDPMHLTKSCTKYLEGMLQSAADMDVRLDYTLYKSCEDVIKTTCSKIENAGKVEDCLKDLFHNGSLVGTCRAEVQLLIQATLVDVHVDPQLNRACAIDLLKICDGIPPGEGRLMACLLNELDREKSGNEPLLSPNCRKLLSARNELFQLAGSPSKLESLTDLYGTVAVSPHKNYFMAVGITIVGMIFIFGLFCGRVTRRSKAASKNK